MGVLQVIESFSTDIDGVPRVFPAGRLVDSRDPVVKGRDRFFVKVEDYVARADKSAAGAVETATAAPGERRSRRGAKKQTAAQKKAAAAAAAKVQEALADAAPPSGADDGEGDPESGPSQIPGENRDPDAELPEDGDGSGDDGPGAPGKEPGPDQNADDES